METEILKPNSLPFEINKKHDYLLVFDIQNDFCEQYCEQRPQLAVPNSKHVASKISNLIQHFDNVILIQDWHCFNHRSFASQYQGSQPYDVVKTTYGMQILWPDHCVANSWGAEFHPELDTSKASCIIRKGVKRHLDSYSGFFENDRVTPTGLDGYLNSTIINKQETTIFIVGLAFDFGVTYSALDSVKLGYHTIVLHDYCAAIDVNNSRRNAIGRLREVGIRIL